MRGRCLVAALPALLSACFEVSSGLMATGSLSRPWLGWPHEPKAAEATQLPEAPLYCYRTLADEVCHAQPLSAAEETRLIGYVGPVPHAP